MTQAVGILLAAVAAFGVSAFSPLLVAKLMPLTEAAMTPAGRKAFVAYLDAMQDLVAPGGAGA